LAPKPCLLWQLRACCSKRDGATCKRAAAIQGRANKAALVLTHDGHICMVHIPAGKTPQGQPRKKRDAQRSATRRQHSCCWIVTLSNVSFRDLCTCGRSRPLCVVRQPTGHPGVCGKHYPHCRPEQSCSVKQRAHTCEHFALPSIEPASTQFNSRSCFFTTLAAVDQPRLSFRHISASMPSRTSLAPAPALALLALLVAACLQLPALLAAPNPQPAAAAAGARTAPGAALSTPSQPSDGGASCCAATLCLAPSNCVCSGNGEGRCVGTGPSPLSSSGGSGSGAARSGRHIGRLPAGRRDGEQATPYGSPLH
jgi:hypothetical protein